MKIKTHDDLESLKKKGEELIHPDRTKITVGMATCGTATGGAKVLEKIQTEVERQGLDAAVTVTGCLGFCQREPLVDVMLPGKWRVLFAEMDSDKASELISNLVSGKVKKEWALCRMEIEGEPKGQENGLKDIPLYEDIGFWSKQRKVALRNCGFINPDSIEEYIARGGYSSLWKVLHNSSPEEIIAEIERSGLRGRGGAGFPTALKWRLCRKSPGEEKYIICNADEGDPGAYMDRSVMEGDPNSVLEGMIIGAYAIGAGNGIIYARAEYPLAIERLTIAINQAREYGILGKDILGSGFDFDVEISRGAGAFVCGEETSLIASAEGRAGEPRSRPPYPAERGFKDKPTNINNVETWANIPVIIERGGDWFSSIGTEKSKGTKVFSIVGKCKNTGLIEVPLGITLKEVIFEIGGGIIDDKKFKAVQTGGPSGGCIPANLLDLPVDYEKLAEAGSIMGSGGMIVMDENTCMVDLSRYFLEFLEDESCGKCFPCRFGVTRMREILDRICAGEGKEEDIDLLKELGQVVKNFSLCGLGQTAPNPVLSTLRYFKDEYEAHIRDKYCPAKVCKRLTPAPCQNACPAGIDVPSYVALISHKQYKEALELILEDNPFPSICGRTCTHSCEFECKRGELDNPISIMYLKRFAADLGMDRAKDIKPLLITKKEKVAIIGAGPAGLTAAYYLIRMGYAVTVFEALPVAGGMMVVGIPEYRLPRDIINAEIEAITALGVEIKTNTKIGKDITIDKLRKDYGAIFLAVGAHKGRKLGIQGEDKYKGFIDSIDFLRDVNFGNKTKPGNNVVVIGGGNSAVDAARTALRLGAAEVNIVYRRSRVEMPAFKGEVDAAEEEGVKLHILVAPTRIVGEKGRVTGLEGIRTELGKPDASGRRRPVPIQGSEFIIPCDVIIPAISQEPEIAELIKDTELKTTAWNTFEVDADTLETNIPGIFAGGDDVTGPATIIEAIAAGQRAAAAIDKYFNKEKLQWRFKPVIPKRLIKQIEIADEEIEKLKREEMPCIKALQRINNFDEVELGYTEEMCVNEAKRCLRCDL
ncbi:MAG: FAD-dependent oxidoreductase [Candidatus Aminicenantes bacterium]|nr:FAD-dependent oxidoreductase [Candidatus Aminicenantes bacterium]NIM81476.1 FAD-dependent oxidoreductase [Candidatus Aminicenantes bacterium]NIN20842.1 FAD-dependent oxidoreductase [Candidatus Aminicenantes bacterium]NIN44663.1 FAD-dependent oxidoreductase [Candidatus Aminicenantes bacterium]NIN87472.1 FAD-dependent oxidoreductase [Candidatus Aminicenantes bacterium]